MEQISGLVWETERPLIDAIRRSPKFWLLGEEWYFTLRLFSNFSVPLAYHMKLHKINSRTPRGKTLKVTTYIRSTATRSCLYEITSDSNSIVWPVWNSSADAADTAFGSDVRRGKWTVIFIFECDQPLQLHLAKNETGLSSSESVTDTELRTTSDAKSLSKAILSEDKSVQACTVIPPDLEILSSEFRQLLESEIFPDVRLRCGDRNISAHRSILAARSDVFTAMFRNKMAESETGTVDITDVDSEILDLMLQYVYAGKIPDLSEDTASNLYVASDMYSIHALKKSCADWMIRNLTVENCLGYLMVADAHSDEEFKERAVDFVAENLESIKKNDWSKFNKDHGGLANSVYQRRLAPALSKQT